MQPMLTSQPDIHTATEGDKVTPHNPDTLTRTPAQVALTLSRRRRALRFRAARNGNLRPSTRPMFPRVVTPRDGDGMRLPPRDDYAPTLGHNIIDSYPGDPRRMSVRPVRPVNITPDILLAEVKRTARHLQHVRVTCNGPGYTQRVFSGAQYAALKAENDYALYLGRVHDARNIVANALQAKVPTFTDVVNDIDRPVMLVTFASDAGEYDVTTLRNLRRFSLADAIAHGIVNRWRFMFTRADGRLVVETSDGFTVRRSVIPPSPDGSDDWVADERERAAVVSRIIMLEIQAEDSQGAKRRNRHTGKSGTALTSTERSHLRRQRLRAGKLPKGGTLPASSGSRLSPGVATNGAASYVNTGQSH